MQQPHRLPFAFCPSPFALCLLPLAFCLFLSACYEPKQGCLDIEATNFDAAADKNCCCEYPKLVMVVSQRFNDKTWSPDSLYESAPGHLIRLRNTAFYFSEFNMVAANGETVVVPDTATLAVFGPNPGDTLFSLFRNDFQLVRRTQVAYPVGGFRQPGLFLSASARLGLSEEANKVVPSKAPSGHPLRPQSEELWAGRDTGFVFLQLVVSRDTAAATVPDTLSFTRFDFDNLVIGSGGNFVHTSGYDFQMLLVVDYGAMLQGVDFQNTGPAAWKAQIVANLPTAFSFFQ